MSSTINTYKSQGDLSKEEIRKLLSNYDKTTIINIPIKRHVRYFSAIRDKDHKVIYSKGGDPKITFKRGGFLKKKQISTNNKGEVTGYIILSNVPIQSKKKGLEWSVPVCNNTTCYSVRPPKNKDEVYQEKFNSQQKEIERLKYQLNKLSKKKRSSKKTTE